MLVPSTETFIPLAVLTASVMGSMHCVSMCGGLVVASCRTKRDVFEYHFGRLLSYMALGALAGVLGKAVLISASTGWIAWVTAAFMATFLITLGIRVGMRKPLHFSIIPSNWTKALLGRTSGKPFLIGAASGFLPCGWLHTFVVAAIATQSPWRGAIFLSVFWLGTLPAMISAPLLIRRIARPLARFAPQATAIFLILAGLGSLAWKTKSFFYPVSNAGVAAGSEMSCHHTD